MTNHSVTIVEDQSKQMIRLNRYKRTFYLNMGHTPGTLVHEKCDKIVHL